VTFEAVQKRT